MNLKVGAHASAAGGVQNAIKNAAELGVEHIQMFGSSPKQYQVRHPAQKNVQEFLELKKQHNIQSVFLHAPYLVNLASPKPFVRHQSKETLKGHLDIADQLNANGVIFHIGSVGKDGDKQQGIEHIVKGMNSVLEKTKTAHLILENGSGGGGKIGTTIQDIADIVKQVDSERVRVCIDTAHIYAGGVLQFQNNDVEEFMKKWRRALPQKLISVLHINDSKGEYGSFLDRHENIGQGHIGLAGFKLLAKNKYLSSLPWILEVPGIEGNGPDKHNVEILKAL